MGLLTWVAFAVVATFTITFLVAGRAGSRARASSPPEFDRLTERIEELSRRLEAMERKVGGN